MTSLDFLYIVLSIFVIVIWTLSAIFLYKAIKILNVLIELVEIYERFREIFDLYKMIPSYVLKTLKELIFNKKD